MRGVCCAAAAAVLQLLLLLVLACSVAGEPMVLDTSSPDFFLSVHFVEDKVGGVARMPTIDDDLRVTCIPTSSLLYTASCSPCQAGSLTYSGCSAGTPYPSLRLGPAYWLEFADNITVDTGVAIRLVQSSTLAGTKGYTSTFTSKGELLLTGPLVGNLTLDVVAPNAQFSRGTTLPVRLNNVDVRVHDVSSELLINQAGGAGVVVYATGTSRLQAYAAGEIEHRNGGTVELCDSSEIQISGSGLWIVPSAAAAGGIVATTCTGAVNSAVRVMTDGIFTIGTTTAYTIGVPLYVTGGFFFVESPLTLTEDVLIDGPDVSFTLYPSGSLLMGAGVGTTLIDGTMSWEGDVAGSLIASGGTLDISTGAALTTTASSLLISNDATVNIQGAFTLCTGTDACSMTMVGGALLHTAGNLAMADSLELSVGGGVYTIAPLGPTGAVAYQMGSGNELSVASGAVLTIDVVETTAVVFDDGTVVIDNSGELFVRGTGSVTMKFLEVAGGDVYIEPGIPSFSAESIALKSASTPSSLVLNSPVELVDHLRLEFGSLLVSENTGTITTSTVPPIGIELISSGNRIEGAWRVPNIVATGGSATLVIHVRSPADYDQILLTEGGEFARETLAVELIYDSLELIHTDIDLDVVVCTRGQLPCRLPGDVVTTVLHVQSVSSRAAGGAEVCVIEHDIVDDESGGKVLRATVPAGCFTRALILPWYLLAAISGAVVAVSGAGIFATRARRRRRHLAEFPDEVLADGGTATTGAFALPSKKADAAAAAAVTAVKIDGDSNILYQALAHKNLALIGALTGVLQPHVVTDDLSEDIALLFENARMLDKLAQWVMDRAIQLNTGSWPVLMPGVHCETALIPAVVQALLGRWVTAIFKDHVATLEKNPGKYDMANPQAAQEAVKTLVSKLMLSMRGSVSDLPQPFVGAVIGPLRKRFRKDDASFARALAEVMLDQGVCIALDDLVGSGLAAAPSPRTRNVAHDVAILMRAVGRGVEPMAHEPHLAPFTAWIGRVNQRTWLPLADAIPTRAAARAFLPRQMEISDVEAALFRVDVIVRGYFPEVYELMQKSSSAMANVLARRYLADDGSVKASDADPVVQATAALVRRRAVRTPDAEFRLGSEGVGTPDAPAAARPSSRGGASGGQRTSLRGSGGRRMSARGASAVASGGARRASGPASGAAGSGGRRLSGRGRGGGRRSSQGRGSQQQLGGARTMSQSPSRRRLSQGRGVSPPKRGSQQQPGSAGRRASAGRGSMQRPHSGSAGRRASAGRGSQQQPGSAGRRASAGRGSVQRPHSGSAGRRGASPTKRGSQQQQGRGGSARGGRRRGA